MVNNMWLIREMLLVLINCSYFCIMPMLIPPVDGLM